MKKFRYYYRPNGDIDFKYNYKATPTNRIAFVNSLPYVESEIDYNISTHCVDLQTHTIVQK